MEDFYNFESELLEVRLPTPLELKEIKQMLLTGERDQILDSVKKIKKFLKTKESVLEILKSDILEFLCDAVLPFDSVVAGTSYQCVEIMATYKEFFTHNHSCFAIESLMRTLHFLTKKPDHFKALNLCLDLLNIILQGYNSHSVAPEKKTFENLLQVLLALKKLPSTSNNKYQIGAFIFNLIELNILKWSRQACETILDSLSDWFILMKEILESDHPMREKSVLLCCTLCHSVSRCLLTSESSVRDVTFEINENSKIVIIKHIYDFLISVAAPYFDTVSLSKLENNFSYLENFYRTILCFYTDEVTPEKTRLIHRLSETGFLQFTTKIISIGDVSEERKLRRLCFLVLFYMILYLAEDVFHFPEVWQRGRGDFRQEVQRGIAELPTDATQWLDVLVDPHANFSCKLALLLYLYFFSMTAKSQDMLQAVYPAIVNFIHFNTEIESSVLLLKLVWFIFVMSQLSVTQTFTREDDFEETNKMVSLLEGQQDLSLVYTHHPALLYWAFSSKISSRVQTQTVHLWLRNKTPDCKELDELMRNSFDVRYIVLDILQNYWGQELDSAFSSLKSLLLDSYSGEELAASIWFLLPQVLAKFTADFTSVANVDYVIELSCLKTPKSLDITKVMRVASLLPEVFLKSDLISVVPSLSLVFQLIKLGRQMEDNRVLWVFLRHEGFIQKIIDGLNTNVSDISILSIKILVALWKECKYIKNIGKRKKLEVKSEIILKILETNCDQVLCEGLSYTEQILLSNFQSPIFEIGGVDEGFVEILFFEIQNACIKTKLDNSNRCWRCLKLFLTEPLKVEKLGTNPSLYELIIFHLPHLKELQELKKFLTIWLDFYYTKVTDPCFGRKIFGGFYMKTLRKVGEELMKNYKEEDRIILEKTLKFGFAWHENTGKQLSQFL